MFGGKIGLPELVIILLILGVVFAVYGQIFRKAGHSRFWALCILVPLVNLVVLLWFAYSKWPIEAELERLRMAQASAGTTGTSQVRNSLL